MHQHGWQTGAARRSTARGVTTGSVLLLAAALTAGSLGGSASAATTTPGAPAMPRPLTPGSVTQPVFPLRDVPGYAMSTHVSARVKSWNGRLDTRFDVPTPAGAQLLFGDWNRDGAFTPVVFLNGHWVVYDVVVGSAPVPSREFDFGAPGDRPVVGDFNKDGRTDVGVVRGNVWLLRNAPSAGTTWRRFALGRPTDVAVTGDWDGNGRSGIGVRRGAEWFLFEAPKAGKPTYRFRFGRPADATAVGDWNGDAADTVGVVRGEAWHLRDQLSLAVTKGMTRKQRRKEARSPVTTRVVTRPADPTAVPVSWPTPAGPSGAACPTASSGVAQRDQLAGLVRPSAILDKALPYDTANPAVGSDPVFQLRMSLLDSERYLLGAQYLDRWYSKRDERYTDVLGRFIPEQQEYAVRRPAMAALTTAVAARTGAHNDELVGRTRDEAVMYADWLVRSIACQHVAVTPGGWGAGWQTAHWATLAGQAAWLLWDRLTPQVREYVAQMVAYEADVRLTKPVEYWMDAARTVVTPGDTKAEENAWNGALLELAVNMMPRHTHAPSWRRKAIDLELGAYATASDITSPIVVNGVSLADRLDGANAFDDGTVENHHIIHPDYMTNIQQSWWAADFAGLAGRKPPVASLRNADVVYGAFTRLSFAPGSPSPAGGVFAEPGGTMYRPGSNDIYFPQGSTWGSVRRAPFISFDAHALAYGLDAGAAWAARDALAQHVAGQRALSASAGAGDGRTYSLDPVTANQQDTYNGREEYAASQLAAGWLAVYVSRNAWDGQFNLPPLDGATYAPLPVLAPGQTGWKSVPQGSSPDDQRRSP